MEKYEEGIKKFPAGLEGGETDLAAKSHLPPPPLLPHHPINNLMVPPYFINIGFLIICYKIRAEQ